MTASLDFSRSREDNPLARKERVLFTLKWLALVGFLAIAGYFAFLYTQNNNYSSNMAAPSPGEPYTSSPPPVYGPEPAMPSMFGPISLILLFTIPVFLIFFLFVMHVEQLPREILGPVVKVLKSLGFEISYLDGRYVTCKPLQEDPGMRVREIKLQFPGSAFTSMRTCIVSVSLNQEQIKTIDIKRIAADQGFSLVIADTGPGLANKPPCLVTSIDVRRVHAKSLNLRLLLSALH